MGYRTDYSERFRLQTYDADEYKIQIQPNVAVCRVCRGMSVGRKPISGQRHLAVRVCRQK